MEDTPITTIVGMWGFAAGIIFGITAQRTNFCTMGAISDAVFMGSYNRMRAWVMAIAVGIGGSQILHMTGQVDLSGAIFLTTNLGWVGAIVGGLLFGFGMTMTGGCGNKTLVRLGGGNLKSLIVAMVMGIAGYATLRGIIGLLRVEFEAVTVVDLSERGLTSQSMVEMVASVIGMETEALRPVMVALVVLALLAWCFKSGEFRSSGRDMIAGLVIGLMIPLGWYITGNIGNDEFDPVPLFSFTFVSPTADSVQYLMTFTGSTINFGVAAVGGVLVGSFLAAKLSGEFHIESFADAADLKRHLFGAFIMGVGGIVALGCTIGQALTGMSTLALSSLIAWMSLLAGGYLGMKYLEEGSLGGALRATFSRS
ncbi:MAG: YeeE/YedE family protein [Alphaproteobacteria bacterium]|jgi:uncharacterized protein|nr:YeeE/YedE family protein [Alphaproteobacteria bacterium]MBT4020043.1 YeeE/YedE family protein [Alphaproteobacteria bacterium]MBT5161885.1 YeeE/YedE family protein [Alphaproteobacteria bacterium]MBT5917284.1 YeeE/YedE family protein [Alphaproteobacteria bacterium]MBT6387589.1 YeeE/YedE family protein [Alphaproteobacteria bacterium]